SGAGQVFVAAPLSTNLTVTLSSGDTTEITVPLNVTILAGSTNAAFDITVVDDNELDGTQNPTITATAPGFSSPTATMAINDNESAVLRVVIPPNAVEGQGSTQATVQVSAPSTVNVAVNLSSSDTNQLRVPPTVTLLSGQTSAVFTVTIVDDT